MRGLFRLASSFVVVIVIVGLGVAGAAWIGEHAAHFLLTAPTPVSSAVVAACGVVVGGVAVAWYQRRTSVSEALRTARVPVYEEFLEFFFQKVLRPATKGRQGLTPEALQDFFMTFTQKAVVVGSDNFVREWTGYRQRLGAGQLQSTDFHSPNHMLVEFEKVLLCIRRDFGYRNRGLNPGDLLSLWINDVPVLQKQRRG